MTQYIAEYYIIMLKYYSMMELTQSIEMTLNIVNINGLSFRMIVLDTSGILLLHCTLFHFLSLQLTFRNLLYTATIVPYSVSFMDDPGPVLNVFEILSDVIWALDIVITFNSAYEDKEDNLIVSRKVNFYRLTTLIFTIENCHKLLYRMVFTGFCVNSTF